MDFLTFKTFISIDALIVFYYMGAVIMPISMWFFMIWIVQKYNIIGSIYEKGKDLTWHLLDGKQKIKLVLFFIICFFFMELFWRMLFEFLIAYMQIRDALLSA